MFSGKSKRDRYLQPKEFEALLRVAKQDADAYLFLRVMGASGMRGVEAERLEIKDVDSARRGVWAWTAKRKDHPIRFLALDRETFSLLEKGVKGKRGGPVFVWIKKPLTRRRMKYLFKSYAKAAKIRPALAVHSLRHYHGTACADAGMMPQEVAARLGHKGIGMVMEYFTLREDRNRELSDRLGKEMFGKEKNGKGL